MGWGWFVFPAAGWLEYGKGKIGKIKKKKTNSNISLLTAPA